MEEREVVLVDEAGGHQEQQQHSIESAKALRAIFEQPQLLEHKPMKKEVQVKRFVVSPFSFGFVRRSVNSKRGWYYGYLVVSLLFTVVTTTVNLYSSS